MHDETGYIPKYLDSQERFIFWDMDQAIIGLLVMGMGVAAGAMLSGMVAGAYLAWQYGRVKAGKHPRFAVHLMYWWLPPSIAITKPKVTPPSDQRYFLG